jgi:hypothetical protein
VPPTRTSSAGAASRRRGPTSDTSSARSTSAASVRSTPSRQTWTTSSARSRSHRRRRGPIASRWRGSRSGSASSDAGATGFRSPRASSPSSGRWRGRPAYRSASPDTRGPVRGSISPDRQFQDAWQDRERRSSSASSPFQGEG